jgi:uncharacterized protein with GYD domain
MAMEFNNRTGYIFIRTQGGNTKKVFEQFKKPDWVIGAWTVTGEYDVIAWVNAKNEDEVYNWANTIKMWEGVEYTNSHFVHNGYFKDMETLNNPNGAWVKIRGDRMDAILTYLKDYNYVGGWVNVPGEYDFLAYVYGDNPRATLENVLRMTENHNWRTYTHIPLYTYVNKNYTKTL